MSKSSNKQTLEELVNKLNENYVEDLTPIKTGIVPFDYMFGHGIGNEVIQIAGDSGTAKTSLALQISLMYCRLGKKVLYLNTQNSVNQDRLQILGLNEHLNKKFFTYKAETFDKAQELLDMFIETDEIDLIIVDSIANLVNGGYLNLEHEGKRKGISIDNNNSNYDTRPLSLFIRKYSALSSSKKFTLILISSMRNKIHKTLGTIEKRFGPKSLDGCCSTIVKINNPKSTDFATKFKSLDNGFPLEFEVIKSTIMRSGVKIPFFFQYGYGINCIHNLVYYLLKSEIIKEHNSYYELKGTGIKTHGIELMLKEIFKIYDALYKNYHVDMERYYLNS